MKPTIIHVITELGSGGAERVLGRLAIGSTAFRHIIVTLTGDGKLANALRGAGIEVVSLHMRRATPSPLALIRLARIIRRNRPEVVQTWLYHADLVGLLAARLVGFRPVVWNIRCSNMDLSLYSWSARIVVRLLIWLSRFTATIIANSDAGRLWHHQMGYRPRRWEIVPNGIDCGAFHPDPSARARWRSQLGIGDRLILIGCLARRDPMKDHEGLLTAAADAARRCTSLAFVLAGRGVTRADPVLARLADEVAAPIHMIDECDDPAGLTAALDIAVLPSAFGEGFPNAVAEAMAAAVPCIVTDVGDAASIVADTGRVVPPKTPPRLADAMVELATDAPLRKALGAAARNRIAQEYSLSAAIARYETIWRKVAMSAETLAPAAITNGAEPAASLTRQLPSDISVVIPVYNRERDIKRAITSALHQTLPPYEVVVVDDGSTDSTSNAVTQIRDPRVRLVKHDRNLGAAAARNTGIGAAAGTWIAFLDSDDEWAADKLARQMKRLAAAPPGVAAVVTGYTIEDERYGTTHVFYPDPWESTLGSLAWGCRISPGSTLLVLRQLFLEVGPLDTRMSRFEDWDWLIRFSATHRLVVEPDALVIVHKSANPSPEQAISSLELIRQKHRAKFYGSSWLNGRRFDSTILLERAACAYYDRHYGLAAARLLQSIATYPFRDTEFFRMAPRRAFRPLIRPFQNPTAKPISAAASRKTRRHWYQLHHEADSGDAGSTRNKDAPL